MARLGGPSNEEARDRWVIQALAAVPAGSRLLDVGAGECRYRAHCGHLRYVSQDFCQYDGKGDDRGLQTRTWNVSRIDIVSDIEAIPEADGAFDAMLCTEVLEHVPDPARALGEISRLIRPGGDLILTAPYASLTHFAPYHYYSGFNRYFYDHWLKAFGLEVVELTPNGNYFSYLAQEIKRVPQVWRETGAGVRAWLAYPVMGLAWLLTSYLGRRHVGSADLACFGYHIRARKAS